MTIAEPSTLATDYALATLTGVLSWRLFRENRTWRQRPASWWAAALAFTSAGSVAGGTYHGFGPSMSPATASALWTLTTWCVGAASFLLLSATLIASCRGGWRWWLVAFAAIKLAVYSWWMLSHDDFIYVIYDYSAALAIVFAISAAGRVQGDEGAGRYIIAGILMSIVAAGLQQSGIDLHRHFNHNDLQHVVQMGAVWLLYRGGRRLRDARQTTISR